MQNLLQNLANLSLTFYKLITKNRWIPTHYIISCAQMLVVGASNILILLIILISILFLDLEIVFLPTTDVLARLCILISTTAIDMTCLRKSTIKRESQIKISFQTCQFFQHNWFSFYTLCNKLLRHTTTMA